MEIFQQHYAELRRERSEYKDTVHKLECEVAMRLVIRLPINAEVNRDLPMPDSPESSTTWPTPAFAFDHRRKSKSSSSSRPTSWVSSSNRVSSNRSLRCRETEFSRQRQRGRNGLGDSGTPLQR